MMKRIPKFSCATVGIALVSLGILPGIANATDVNPGHDLFVTGDGSSHDFRNAPIPADFFGPGSDPFDGVVDLQGAPIATFDGFGVGDTDTIVERLQVASHPAIPSVDTIDIELVALSLTSVNPITVTFNGGQNPELWDVDVSVSPTGPSIGTMTINHLDAGGGTYDADLSVFPLFTFTKVGESGLVLELDTGAEGLDPIQMSTNNSPTWEHVPANGQRVVPGLTGDESNLGAPGDTDFYVFGAVEHTGPHPRVEPTPGDAVIPTVSEWGLVVMTLLGLAVGTIVFARRRMRGTPSAG